MLNWWPTTYWSYFWRPFTLPTMILKHLMPPKLILKKPSPTSFSLEIPINLLGFEDGSKKNKTKRHFKFTENGFFFTTSKTSSGRLLYLWWFTGYKKHFVKDEAFTSVSYFNDSDTRSGYFRLKCSYGQVPMPDQNTPQTELGLFLQAYLRAFLSRNTELVKKFLWIF